ncbi:MAG: hypothetical protein N3A66_05215 [Planctomycetota bacterium]|nr:hypothetical protein [Planctomycetota bacterium]
MRSGIHQDDRMSAKDERYRIVLGSVATEQQPRIAAQIADLFAIPAEMAAQIVRQAPAVILSGLSRQQAMEMAAALAPLREAGAELRIASGEDHALPHVSWPSPPRLLRQEQSIASPPLRCQVVLACPCCGAQLRLVIQPEQPAASAPRPAPLSKAAAKPTDAEAETVSAPAFLEEDEDDPLFASAPPLVETQPDRPVLNRQDFIPPQPTAFADSAEAATRPAPAIAEDRVGQNGERGPFNVIISGGAGNPRAIALVKEVLRVAEKDAALLLQKPSLTVAQGVSRETAVKVAGRFKAINIAVRITQMKSAL